MRATRTEWMALEHLSSRKNKFTTLVLRFKSKTSFGDNGKTMCGQYLLFALCFFSASAQSEVFNDYQSAKMKIQSLIGNAQSSVYLRSKLMTDGDIVMSLFTTKYRGLDTKVVLSNGLANQYLSRYRDLMKQGLPTSPKTGSWTSPTSLIIDGKLYEFSAPLDFRIQAKNFELLDGNEQQKNLILADFAQPGTFKISSPDKILPEKSYKSPIPAAAKSTKLSSQDSKDLESAQDSQTPSSQTQNGNGYRYRVQKSAVPVGVDTKLPRKPKWQLKHTDQMDSDK